MFVRGKERNKKDYQLKALLTKHDMLYKGQHSLRRSVFFKPRLTVLPTQWRTRMAHPCSNQPDQLLENVRLSKTLGLLLQ